MKKIGLWIPLAAALCLCLAGCHGSEVREAFSVPESFDTGKKLELTFWAKNDTNKNQTRIYEKAVSDFEALYPNVSVKVRFYTDYGKIYNDVITNIATGTTPNVCVTYPDHIATYLTGNNIVASLDELFDDEEYGFGGSGLRFESPKREEVIEEFLEECRLEGHYYAVPFMRSTEALFINKDYVEALGYELPEVLTWDYIWEVSDAATAKNADGTYVLNGQNVMLPFIYKSTDNMMIQMLKQQDAGYSTEDGEILIFNDSTKDILYEIGDHVAKGAFSTFKTSGYPANFLDAGQCVFAVDSTAGSTWMGSDAPLSDISEDERVDFETAVRIVPQYDVDDPRMISQGPSICIFQKDDPQEVLAAWLFVQFLLTNEVQTAYSGTEGYVPVTHAACDSPEYQDYLSRGGEDEEHYKLKIDAAKLLLDNVEHTFVTPVFNGSVSLRDAAGQLIENVVKSVRRKQVLDEAYMDKLFSDVSSLYRLDQISAGGPGKEPGALGPLPFASKVLLLTLAVVWGLILVYVIVSRVRRT